MRFLSSACQRQSRRAFPAFVDIQPCVEFHEAAQNLLPFAVAEPRQFVRAAGFGVVNPIQAR
ncbi:MAG: hypothetical protein DME69_04600 [Verrucomicrobia bacterium]|nr:MAG: hypothetical protein DME69_04600 [Verrucomicrobiota bacterium]